MQSQTVEGEEQVGRPLSKLAVQTDASQAVVVATVLRDGAPVIGAKVEFSRSIAGQVADYQWSGVTDSSLRTPQPESAIKIGFIYTTPNRKNSLDGATLEAVLKTRTAFEKLSNQPPDASQNAPYHRYIHPICLIFYFCFRAYNNFKTAS